MNGSRHVINACRRLAADAARQAHVPYSGGPTAVILLLSDGRWIPGVRVESASFSLTIPPLLNAVTTAVALNAGEIRAAVASRPFHPQELTFASRMTLLYNLPQTASDVLGTISERPGDRASPFVRRQDFDAIDARKAVRPMDLEEREPAGGLVPREAIARARDIARRAHVPESNFPVGCLLEIENEGYIPGVNVDHDDWMHALCAERNALGTALSYGYAAISSLYLSCLCEPGCSPCGACRQLLAELAPASALWMDGGNESPAFSDPVTLLPDSFAGKGLSRDI